MSLAYSLETKSLFCQFWSSLESYKMFRWKVTLRTGGVDMMLARFEVDVWIRFGDFAVEVELMA